MVADADIAVGRRALYDALRRRNRWIAVLRVVVPGAGVAVLLVLGAQMLIASMIRDFSIGRVTVDRNRVHVETPSYNGRMDDGSTYEISAASAEASLDSINLIDLNNALMIVNRPTGVQATVTALAAQIESQKQQVTAPGLTEVADTTGLTGQLMGMHIDFETQKLTASGPVTFAFPSGETLESVGMTYDAAAKVWTFSQVTLTLPGTPGEETP